jgi:ABC-2 type transport system permease protein
MNKTGLVFQREYLTRVQKRSFLLLTILIPLIIIGFYVALIAVSLSGDSTEQRIAVIDKAGVFGGKDSKQKEFTFHLLGEDQQQSLLAGYDKQGYDGYLLIPAGAVDLPDSIHFQRKSETGSGVQSDLNEILSAMIGRKRMAAAHIDPDKIKELTPDISLNATIGNEAKQSVSDVARIAGMSAGFLIYFILLIYGTMVMRGVTEEKTTRMAEVIISSVKPFQLMLGKILGIGAVGLTQFVIWGGLIFVLQLIIPYAFPQLSAAAHGTGAAGTGGLFAMFLHQAESLNFPLILGCFIFYFLGGYLLYASLYAAIGSAVSDDPQEAQQMAVPITLLIVFSLVIMSKATANPNSSLAVFGSIFPLTSPIVMMGRIPYGIPTIPLWQLIASMVLLIACFLGTTWLCGKIYRIGILLYGKKVTLKEMARWAIKKN